MKILAITLLCLAFFAQSQLHNEKILPKSASLALPKNVEIITLPKIDFAKVKVEEESESKQDLAPRYGVPHFVTHTTMNSGTFYTTVNGDKIWRSTYRSEGAYFLVVEFDKFFLAPGATLHVITKSGEFLGAFTNENNKQDETFSVGPIHGEEFTLELYEPVQVVSKSYLRVKAVVHSYKDLFGNTKNGRSGACNINVACPSGKGWEGEIASVAVLLQSSGFRFCTGNLINNLKQDGTQLFLTAAHCGTGPATWIALFNYQQSGCTSGVRLTNYTLSGFDTVSRNTVSDFHLMKLRERIPQNYNLYLSGFSAVDAAEREVSVGIHHPSGDAKKISHCRVPLTSSNWGGGPANTHWRVEPWVEGTTEPGSSGSPLFDSKKRVIGQLHGGTASCSNMRGWDVYGKIAVSWTIGNDVNSRLKDHLDPTNSGKLVVDGVWVNELRRKNNNDVISK